MSRLTRDGTAETVSRDHILRRERGQGNIHFPCSADHEQDWQPFPVDPYCCYMRDHTPFGRTAKESNTPQTATSAQSSTPTVTTNDTLSIKRSAFMSTIAPCSRLLPRSPSWNIIAHHGTSWNIIEHHGTSWNVTS